MEKNTVIQKPVDEFMGMAMTADTVVAQQALVKDVIRKVMKKDVHFGIIPGCQKPSLYKPGAEVLNLTFRLAPDYVTETIVDGKHMTVRSKCILTHIPSGKVFGSGEAICTTKEKKYRLRKDQGKIVENGNLEDSWNTILKMGNKRALIAAVLNVTACSDEFTQDMGEEVEPLVVVDTPQKEEIKDTPVTVKDTPKPADEPLRWTGKVSSIQPQQLPSGAPCWEIKGDDECIFKTDVKKWSDAAGESLDDDKPVEILYKLNSKKTRVINSLKVEAING